ncbi:MAG: AI-2E family transporter [Schleiferiaceae bacterium]
MNVDQITKAILNVLFKLAVITGLIYLLWAVQSIIIYFAIAGVLSLIGTPVVEYLQKIKIKKKHLPKWAAALFTMFIMVTVLFSAGALIIPELMSELELLSTIDFKGVYSGLEDRLFRVEEKLAEMSLDAEFGHEHLKDHLGSFLNAQTISNTFTNLVGSLGNVVIAMFSILFMLFFLLKENHLSRRMIMAMLPDRARRIVKIIFPKVKRSLGRYFIGLLIQQGIIFTFVLIGLTLIGIDNAVTIALFASILNLIPYLGPIIGMSFGVVLGMGEAYALQMDINYGALGFQIILVFLVVQMIDNFVSQPLIFSNSINAHPLEIFIIISIAGTLAGITGMVVAVPVYSVIRVTCFEFFPKHSFVRFLKREDVPELE